MIEEQLQAKCFEWFWNTFEHERQMLFHVDNNSWNEIIGQKKRSLGVCSGVSDLVYILPSTVVFIEMKVPGGTQSDTQKEFMLKLINRQINYYIVNSFEGFKKLITLLQETYYV